MSKHTQGPWTCTPTSHHAHEYRLGIPGGQMPFERGGAVQYANAALIAAAPDLLDALKAALPLLKGHQETPERKARYEAAMAAIAKAGGAA